MKYDYTDKKVFVGIDVHKKTYSLVCVCDGSVVKRWTTVAAPKALSWQLKKYFAGASIKTVYEAGFSGFVLYRCLVADGIDNIIVNPASIEVATRDKVKTDKRDALKMTEQLSVGRLRCIYIPSEEQEQARLLSRTRASLIKKRTSTGQQIKNRLYQFGLILADSIRKMSQKWIKELIATDLGYELNITLKILGDLWFELTKKINEMNKYLQKQGSSDICGVFCHSSL